MAEPTPFDRQTSFALFTAENPGVAHSGVSLDTEFNAVKVSLDETQANLALIQRADGRLANLSVGREQLDSSITIGFDSPEGWATATEYSAGFSTVFYEAKFYSCLVDHTSGTFAADLAADKWLLVADLSLAAALDDGSVTTPKLAAFSVTEDKLGNGAVGSTKLATGAATTTKIADENVTTAKLADNAVTHEKVDGSIWSTGDVKFTLKTAADSGWVLFNDSTIGDASSGAGYANANAQALFTLLYNNTIDANCPVATSTGTSTTRAAQGSAAAAWAAHCRMVLPRAMGRALAVAGSGSGLTARALAAFTGDETHTLTEAQLPSINRATSGGSVSGSVTTRAGTVTVDVGVAADVDGGSPTPVAGSFILTHPNFAFGSGGNHPNVQPTVFLNAMVKL